MFKKTEKIDVLNLNKLKPSSKRDSIFLFGYNESVPEHLLSKYKIYILNAINDHEEIETLLKRLGEASNESETIYLSGSENRFIDGFNWYIQQRYFKKNPKAYDKAYYNDILSMLKQVHNKNYKTIQMK